MSDHSSIDDDRNAERVLTRRLRLALDVVLAGKCRART
jgi:hypothetical protein